MMIKDVKLRGKIRLENDRSLTFESSLYDGTPFSVKVTQFDVELNEEFTPNITTVSGWLFVRQESQQDSRVYLTLPKPSLEFGRQILVRDLQLMPRHATLQDFNPRTIKAQQK